jgi:hypothetical protein
MAAEPSLREAAEDAMKEQKQRHQSTGLIVGGAILAAVAAVALATAGTAIWADRTQRDSNGYVSTSTHRYTSPGRAIATDKVTIGSDVPGWIAGKLRLAASSSSKPVFLGIARQADVDRYLEDTSYATATEVDLDPFKVTYVAHPGNGNPGRPADQTFWAASTSGGGTHTLTWKLESGEWSLVLMNADGSPGVSASISTGAELPWILWAGIGLAVLGGLLALTAATMIYRGSKSVPGHPPAASPATAL